MALRTLIAALSLVVVSALSLQGCSKNAQKVQPETRGKRGETCLARNDCDSGLACISGICSKNEFNLDVSAKQCTRVECEDTNDCCGNKETSAPKKCAGRNEICDPANSRFADCTPTICTTATEATVCGKGTCLSGTCAGGSTPGVKCETAADCGRDTCNIATSYCTINSTIYCGSTDANCGSPVCATRSCNCQNPAYNPNDPICSDPACEDICLLRCEDSLCLEDKSCKTDAQCVAVGLQICDGGRCVECVKAADCDEEEDETCIDGACHKPCTENEECPLLSACKEGECVYVGCNDDRECILAASRLAPPVNGNAQAAVSGADDPRLYKCLANEADPEHKTCKIPCENDASCGQFQACDDGYCKFVGCDTDEQCRNYLGIANQMTSESKPYVAKAKCVAPTELDVK